MDWRNIVFLIVVIIGSGNGQGLGSRYQQDAAVMAHVIGNGAMNMEYYFHTLGVWCENTNPSLWRVIDQGKQRCTSSRSRASARYYDDLPKGSFEKMCRKWRMEASCNRNLARDLNDCLGGFKGSDALAFMDSYLDFTCRDVRDSETQLQPIFPSLGVFKCFPELQERILSCVKKDTRSTSLCSNFQTVQLCFAEHYTSDKNCNQISVVGYLRDLFRTMTATLRCPPVDLWDHVKYKPIKFEPISYPYLEFDDPSVNERHLPESRTFLHEVIVKARPEIKPIEQPSPGAGATLIASPRNADHLWAPIPVLLPLVQLRQQSDPSASLTNVPSSGTEFNLEQKSTPGPAWAYGYERYAYPQGNGEYDRFYSFRQDPREDQESHDGPDHGVYDIHGVNYNRYGIPPQRPRGLSNRRGQSSGQRYLDLGFETTSTTWDPLDNHLRRIKDDHTFRTETESPFEHELYLVPATRVQSSTAKRRVNVTNPQLRRRTQIPNPNDQRYAKWVDEESFGPEDPEVITTTERPPIPVVAPVPPLGRKVVRIPPLRTTSFPIQRTTPKIAIRVPYVTPPSVGSQSTPFLRPTTWNPVSPPPPQIPMPQYTFPPWPKHPPSTSSKPLQPDEPVTVYLLDLDSQENGINGMTRKSKSSRPVVLPQPNLNGQLPQIQGRIRISNGTSRTPFRPTPKLLPTPISPVTFTSLEEMTPNTIPTTPTPGRYTFRPRPRPKASISFSRRNTLPFQSPSPFPLEPAPGRSGTEPEPYSDSTTPETSTRPKLRRLKVRKRPSTTTLRSTSKGISNSDIDEY